MKMVVASDDRIKQAFRAAYDFMKTHNDVLTGPEDYKNLAGDARAEYAKYEVDPLTRNLIYAVFSTVVEISEVIGRMGGQNDAEGITERP